MVVSVTAAVSHSLAWLIWAARLYCCHQYRSSIPSSTSMPLLAGHSSNISSTLIGSLSSSWHYNDARRYAWKIVFTMVGLVMAGLLEVFDFPPIMGLWDAHSIWHGITPLLSYSFYSFLIDDALAHVHRTKNR
jgi:hypothetical protein